jgi:hypothetical protein
MSDRQETLGAGGLPHPAEGVFIVLLRHREVSASEQPYSPVTQSGLSQKESSPKGFTVWGRVP